MISCYLHLFTQPKAAIAAALAIVVALKLYGMTVSPLFRIFRGVPYSGTVQFGIMFFFIYISLMIVLEKVARVKLDYCDTIIKAITFPTIIVLVIVSLGLALTLGPPRTAEQAKESAVTEEEAASEEGEEEEAPPAGKDADAESGGD